MSNTLADPEIRFGLEAMVGSDAMRAAFEPFLTGDILDEFLPEPDQPSSTTDPTGQPERPIMDTIPYGRNFEINTQNKNMAVVNFDDGGVNYVLRTPKGFWNLRIDGGKKVKMDGDEVVETGKDTVSGVRLFTATDKRDPNPDEPMLPKWSLNLEDAQPILTLPDQEAAVLSLPSNEQHVASLDQIGNTLDAFFIDFSSVMQMQNENRAPDQT